MKNRSPSYIEDPSKLKIDPIRTGMICLHEKQIFSVRI